MKFYLLMLLALANISFCKNSYLVEGTITFTGDYCGGAAPPENLIEALRTPTPLANKTIYYRAGTSNNFALPVDSFTTDANGDFKLHLTKKSYIFFDASKLEKLQIPQNDLSYTYDTLCLKEAYFKGDFIITRGKTALQKFTYNYHQYCSYNKPCAEYHGPYPPSIAPIDGRNEFPENR